MDRNSVNWYGPDAGGRRRRSTSAARSTSGALQREHRPADRQRRHRHRHRRLHRRVLGADAGRAQAAAEGSASKAMRGRGTVIAGTGAIGVSDTIALTQAAQDAGCDGALILPPYFVKLTDDEIFAHYEAISRAVDGADHALQHPGQRRERADARACRAPCRPRHGRRGQGELAATGTTTTPRDRRAGSAARVLRPVLGVRRAGGRCWAPTASIDCFPNMWAPGGLDLFYAARDGRIEEARRAAGARRASSPTCSPPEGARSIRRPRRRWSMLGLPGGKLRPPLQPLARRAARGLAPGLVELGLIAAPRRRAASPHRVAT